MEDYSRQQRKRNRGRARERHLARKRRKESMFNIKNNSVSKVSNVPIPKGIPSGFTKMRLVLRDFIWMFFSHMPVFRMTASVLIAVFVVFIGSYVLSGRIFPNIYAMDIALGDLTIEEAEAALQTEWENNVWIDLTIDGQVLLQASPAELGLEIDIAQTAIAAKNLGLSGILLGTSVAPVTSLDYATAQMYLLNLTEEVYTPAYDAGYEWQAGELVAIQGQVGRQLNISLSLERLARDPASVIANRRLELLTTELLPKAVDASLYLDEAYAFLASDIVLQGYDPFLDEIILWEVDSDTVSSWLATGTNGLSVREDVFIKYIQELNKELVNSERPRYLDEQHSLEKLQEALRTSNPVVTLRVRYLPQSYEVKRGDNGFSIGRSNGIPFQLISEINPTVDWDQLSVGEQIQIPSRDALVSLDPVLNKRIIVDLESQWLVAFENDEIVFSWGISSGRATAPTYPGVFQILSHTPVAYGSSYALCNSAGTDCGEWEMSWFMGIYEVIPGLVNGFHGAVLLPDGTYLGGGGVSQPSTFGCLMSRNDNGKRLYDWAQVGTMVEILSEDYQPESELGRRALEFISTIDTSYRPLPA